MAAAPKRLRTVKAGERPVPARPLTVSEAAEGGNQRELLVAMRTRIAKSVEDPNTPARDLAALTKRLMEVVRDIEALDARKDQEAAERDRSPDEAFEPEAI